MVYFDLNPAKQSKATIAKPLSKKEALCQKGSRSCSATPTMTMTRLAYGCCNTGQSTANISILRFTPPSRAWRRPQSRLDEKNSPLFFSCLSSEMQRKKTKLKEKPVGQNKKKIFLSLYSLSAFSCLICADSRQFMILDPVSGWETTSSEKEIYLAAPSFSNALLGCTSPTFLKQP